MLKTGLNALHEIQLLNLYHNPVRNVLFYLWGSTALQRLMGLPKFKQPTLIVGDIYFCNKNEKNAGQVKVTTLHNSPQRSSKYIYHTPLPPQSGKPRTSFICHVQLKVPDSKSHSALFIRSRCGFWWPSKLKLKISYLTPYSLIPPENGIKYTHKTGYNS